MDVRHITNGGGLLAALAAALVLGAPLPAIAAGALGGLVGWGAGRGTAGVAAGSLALAAAVLLVAFGAPPVGTAAGTVAVLAIAAGLAGCLAAVVGSGRVSQFVGAWAAFCLLPVGWFVVPVAATQPAGSLLGARLAWLDVTAVTLAVPAVVAASGGAAALGGWRDANLPPWLLTVGPAGVLVGGAVMVVPSTPDVGGLLGGNVATTPVAYVLLWSTATGLVASALAAGVAATDHRYRRPPAWLAASTGPAVITLVVALDGGVFVRLALAALPPASGAVGAVAETAAPAAGRSFAAAATVAGVAMTLVLPTRLPVLGRAMDGRPAGVGAGCLLVGVALAGGSPGETAVAGSLAVLAWALLVRPAPIAPPPRTALVRAGALAGAIGLGAFVAVTLVGRVPTSEPGVGGVLLLSGVAVLGLSLR